MMKRQYYLEICDSDAICGGIYPLGIMTEKQALKEAERRIKELWRSDKERYTSIRFNIGTDEDCCDMVYSIHLFKGDITIYDFAKDKIIKDTMMERINRLSKEMDEAVEVLQNYVENHHSDTK